MSKQVPEASGQDADIAYLRDRLAGNQSFGRLRGTMHEELLSRMGRMARESASPTAFKDAFGEYMSDAQVMGVLLAQLERDGRTEAATLLTYILEHGGILPNEEFPIEQMEDITFVMLDPERTIPMLLFILEGQFEVLDTYARMCERKSWEGVGMETHPFTHAEIEELFLRFPSLKQLVRERYKEHRNNTGRPAAQTYTHALVDILTNPERMAQEIFDSGEYVTNVPIPYAEITTAGSEILTALALDVFKPFRDSLTAIRADPRFLSNLQLHESQYFHPRNKSQLLVRFRPFHQHLAYLPFIGVGAFLFRGDQKAVFSFFSREEQERILTLHFRIPKLALHEHPDKIMVGIYPESEHVAHQGKMTSGNLSSFVHVVQSRLGGRFSPLTTGQVFRVEYPDLRFASTKEEREKPSTMRRRRIPLGIMPRIIFRVEKKHEKVLP